MIPLRRHAWMLFLGCLLLAVRGLSAASLEISIRPVFADEPLLLDSLRYRNASGETLSVTRLSYLLSGFALERSEGGWVELPGQYAWMDAAAHRSAVTVTEVPPGKYRGIRFSVGLDPEANLADPAKFAPEHPLNPNLNGLNWSWQGGYIFVALEGLYRSGGQDPKGYALHLARDPNRTWIVTAADLNLNRDAALGFDLDLAVLLNAPRQLSFERDGSTTHSRDGDAIARSLAANLPGAFRLRHTVFQDAGAAKSSPVRPLYLPAKYTPYRFTMSGSFPIPDLPRDNPLIEERVTLGKRLFSDTALSRGGSTSCATCHASSFAFSDPRRFSAGVHGDLGTRHAMPLFNLAWKTSFFWDGRAPSLRAQALTPIQDHAEMDETIERVAKRLASTDGYATQFTAAFGSPEITGEKIGLAIEQYLLTLVSCNSRFDRAMKGAEQFTAQEQHGFELFMTEYEPRTQRYGGDCFHCHGGPLFTDHQFHNDGLPLSGADPGRYRVTKSEADRGKFVTPSLRNVALTGPYMHDGRFATLEEVIDHYSTGIARSSTLDPNLAKHPDGGLSLSPDDKAALVAFLKTLTDERFVGGGEQHAR